MITHFARTCQKFSLSSEPRASRAALITHVLNDPQLSQKYRIRAITRDADSQKSRLLKEKVEVVEADFSQRISLEMALSDVHTVFAMTVPSFSPDGLGVEFNNGKLIADTAVHEGARYIIFSTLPGVNDLSDGKYHHVTPFDAKAKVEQYIRDLPIKSAFISLGFFMQNLHTQPFLGPQPAPDGSWTLSRHIPQGNRLPYIDAFRDTGAVVGPILMEPDKYAGKTFCAAAALYSLEELVALISRATGKRIIYKQISIEEFKDSLPFAPDLFADGFSFQNEFGGYWGPESHSLFSWTSDNIRGRLSTLEEYLEAHPLQLP